MVEDYFRHIYPLPSYAFFHKTSVIQRCIEGTMEESLSLAICAITTFHLKYDKFFPAQSSRWVQKAEDTILQNLEHPSIFKLQAFLLIIRYRIEVGQFSRAFMLAALVSRSAFALRLNYEHPNLCFLAQEIRRRLMWSFIVDGHFSVGLSEFELCPQEIIYLQLPCTEEAFENEIPTKTGPLRSASLDDSVSFGLYSLCVRLTAIRRDIMKQVLSGHDSKGTLICSRLSRRILSSDHALPTLPESIREFEKELQ